MRLLKQVINTIRKAPIENAPNLCLPSDRFSSRVTTIVEVTALVKNFYAFSEVLNTISLNAFIAFLIAKSFDGELVHVKTIYHCACHFRSDDFKPVKHTIFEMYTNALFSLQ